MGELAKLAKARSPFLQVEPGKSTVCVYKGYKMIPDTFDPTKEKFRFILIEDGVEKFFDTSSNRVALVMDEAAEEIKNKTGKGFVKVTRGIKTSKDGKTKTQWEAENVMDESGTVSKKQAEDFALEIK